VPLSVAEQHFGGTFKPVTGQAEVEQLLKDAGPGARGIVYGARTTTAHVWNAINEGGKVHFIDAQVGAPGSFSGYRSYQFMFTHAP
jgi:hypothetical protein